MLTTTNPTGLDPEVLADLCDEARLEASDQIQSVLEGRREFFDFYDVAGQVARLNRADLTRRLEAILTSDQRGAVLAAGLSQSPAVLARAAMLMSQAVYGLAVQHAERVVRNAGVRHG